MPRILGIKPHQKQGELQTVSNQPPHHVSSLAFLISGLFRIPTKFIPARRGSVAAYYAKRTQSQYGHGMPCPKNAKRTQSTVSPPAHTPKCAKRTQFTSPHQTHEPYTRNEPNLPHPTVPSTQKCETNPIYPTATIPTTQMRKTNPIYACPSLAHDPNMRNEPNYSSGRKSPVRARHAVPLKCKTNPI